jgi:manganese/iron transport system ATP-binding protein
LFLLATKKVMMKLSIFDEINRTKHWIVHHHQHIESEPILKVSNLVVRYDGATVLDEVDFDLQAGDRLAVVGPNGAGKSTLFKVIAGILEPGAGKVHVYGHEPGGHICISYVPQRSQVDWNFPVTVADVTMMGRIGRLGFFRNPGKKDWDVVHQSLEVVGMQHLVHRQIAQLSGGQQQRMFIARALAQEAELMLMDEPLTGLDAASQEDIFQILEKLKERKVTILVAMHDLEMARERFDLALLLNHRIVGFGAPAEVFVPDNLLTAYSGRLHILDTSTGMLALGDTCCEEDDLNHA